MRNPFRRGRKSLREQFRLNKAWIEFHAAATDKPSPIDIVVPPAPKAREVRRPVDGKPPQPLEKHVLAAALNALRSDPRVAFADRQQSGLFQDGNRYIRVGTPGKLDIVGMLTNGRYLELEAKRPGQKPDERQARRIEFVKRHGGIAGYFTSADEALALLP